MFQRGDAVARTLLIRGM
ncbi:hypothetical protein, partial [Frankia casuarinae]